MKVGVDHIGMTVSDLDHSIAFYERHFGGVVEMRMDEVDDPRVAIQQGFDLARFDVAFLSFGDDRIELIRYGSRPTAAG